MYIELINKYRKEIMGMAAIWILLFHKWQTIFDTVPLIGNAERIFVRIGFCGVDMFLLISGMGLVNAIQKYSVIRFWIRRYKRLVMPYTIFVLLTSYANGWGIKKTLLVFCGYGLISEDYPDILWFAIAIGIFYLLFPLYYKVFSKATDKKLFTVIALEIWILCSVVFSNHIPYGLFGTTNRIPVFLVGVLLGWIGQNGDIKIKRDNVCVLVMTLLVGLVLSYFTNYRKMFLLVPVSNCCIPNLLMSISICMLVAPFIEKMKRKQVLRKVLAFLGMVSFEVYCAQSIPDQYLFWRALGTNSILLNNIVNIIGYAILGGILFFLNSIVIGNSCVKRFGKRV